MHLSKLSNILVAVFISASNLVLPAYASMPLDPVTELNNFLNPIQSLSADFAQTVVNGEGKILQQAHGKMRLQRPNKIRWHVQQPDESLLISDGDKIWNYEPGLEQVTIQKVKGKITDTPLGMIFTEQQQLDKNFTITRIDNANHPCHQNAKFCFKLKPKDQEADQNFQGIEIGFNDEDVKIIRLLDQLGQTTIFKFSNNEMNPKYSSKEFSFTPPKDVDIIGN